MVLVDKQAVKAFLYNEENHGYPDGMLKCILAPKSLIKLMRKLNAFVSRHEQIQAGCCRHREAHSSHAG